MLAVLALLAEWAVLTVEDVLAALAVFNVLDVMAVLEGVNVFAVLDILVVSAVLNYNKKTATDKLQADWVFLARPHVEAFLRDGLITWLLIIKTVFSNIFFFIKVS